MKSTYHNPYQNQVCYALYLHCYPLTLPNLLFDHWILHDPPLAHQTLPYIIRIAQHAKVHPILYHEGRKHVSPN